MGWLIKTPELVVGGREAVQMKASPKEERWVNEFVARQRRARLREDILAEAWRDNGRIERHSAAEGDVDWIRVNRQDLGGGPANPEHAREGIEMVEALEQERPPLVQRESPRLYRLTPAGRSVARTERRGSR